ncbi:Pleiotrophic factor-alpha-1 precursor, putative [Pediculus humanus corporis]|uniref:Pleiotrophic factor-alpha-1, putative n=1 Tax=Pediculus humanus subsp. corporis TaxID=121224 RepID=E0VZD6_PEDHC|nr:Pleiotrophic factor-alpha-1 precursor, putative [Pediculus humanus corporis]EEB18742.1 Pleiotrophic factor-alpha-1 precursor, putative [Pediculus humanus corporis]
MKWNYFTAAFLVLFAVAAAEGEIWEEDDHEVLIRSERGAKSRGGEPCRYIKGPWTDCDPKTTLRTRTLTLKKGDSTQCEPTKTIQKKCKKACRYEKGNWSECNGQSQIVRIDKLKPNSDTSCEQSREITRKCKTKTGKGKNSKSNYQSNSNNRKTGGGGRRNKQ